MGKLIVIEGSDGSGKTTQLNMLCQALDEKGRRYRKLEFPCYAEESSALVRLYLSGAMGSRPGDVNAFAASSFYAVDRYASYKQHWEQDYRDGMLFVSGRYTTSNAIHQGSKLSGQERIDYWNWLFDYEYRMLQLPKPDAVIFLDVPFEVTAENIRRRAAQTDIHESDTDYLRQCYECSVQAAETFGWLRIPCIANQAFRSPEDIHGEILETLNRVNLC